MLDQSAGFYALAIGFVALFNVIVIAALLMSYRISGRDYLRIACFAAVCEILRLGSDMTIGFNEDSITSYLLADVFQFGSTLFLVAALLLVFERVTGIYHWLFGLLGAGLLATLVAYMVLPAPSDIPTSYIYATPLILITLMLFWRAAITGPGVTPSKVFLTLASLILLSVRVGLPALPLNELYLLLYYIEYLCFIVILIAIALYELEFANRKVHALLDERTRSEQDLQFIVDNSLDVILVTDEVGLLQSWSNKAREIFGYASDQVVGKIHMDDLFSSNYWGRDIGQQECFKTEMENVDGVKFPVEVRMREVSEAGSSYCIFVVNVLNLDLEGQVALQV